MMPVEPQRSGGTSEGQRLAESNKMPPPGSNRIDAESVGHLSQSGHLVMGPGARRDTAAGNIFNSPSYCGYKLNQTSYVMT